ncbi:MAG: peptidoglycan DD-metalloendopeptidase family protein [Christensenellales bacterium]|jgi:murein DD-endopeptidase MepM/ murein hydrolase activator NlpD
MSTKNHEDNPNHIDLPVSDPQPEREPSKRVKPKHKMKFMAQLVNRQGFVFVLAICVGLVGITAAWGAMRSRDNSGDPGLIVQANPSASASASPSDGQDFGVASSQKEDDPTESPDPSSSPSGQPQPSESPDTSSPEPQKPVSATPKVTLRKPVEGEISMKYAMEELIYSSTLNEWRTHAGIDIKAAEGTTVVAAMGGTVSDIRKDMLYGNVVELQHEGGYATMYAGLSAVAQGLEIGQSVTAGQAVGTVGNTVTFEVDEGAHLHFEVTLAGKPVNPEDYF